MQGVYQLIQCETSACDDGFSADYKKERKTWYKLPRKSNRSPLIVKKKYFSIKISTSLLFYMLFGRKVY